MQQNCLQEKLNIYYLDYIKYLCGTWKRAKMKKKMQRKISSLTISSRAVIEAKKKKKKFVFLYFSTLNLQSHFKYNRFGLSEP